MQINNVKVLLILKLLSLLVFRLIRYLVQLESDVVALCKRIYQSSKDPVEFFHILSRHHLDQSDVNHEDDFLLFNDTFGKFDEIESFEWHIYSISQRYVYFVRVSSTDDISILKHDKLSNLFYDNADRMARMSLDVFCQINNSYSPIINCKALFLHSTPSSGATMTAKLIQSADISANHLVVLGEVPAMTSLSVLAHELSIEKMRELSKAVLRYTLRNYDKSYTVIFKTRSCCSRIIPHIHHACPSIQHLFVTSKNPTESIVRLVQNTSRGIPLFSVIAQLMTSSNFFCDFFTSWRRLEKETVTKIGPSDDVEFSLAQVMGATINYQKNLKYFALETIYFEDLMSETASALRPLLYVCGLSELVIPECINWKRVEEPKIRRMWDTGTLSEEKRARIKTLVELLQNDWNY